MDVDQAAKAMKDNQMEAEIGDFLPRHQPERFNRVKSGHSHQISARAK
jgi:hypothetical protein